MGTVTSLWSRSSPRGGESVHAGDLVDGSDEDAGENGAVQGREGRRRSLRNHVLQRLAEAGDESIRSFARVNVMRSSTSKSHDCVRP